MTKFRFFLIFVFFMSCGSFFAQETYKKKILVFTCNGGGGHMSVSRALEAYLDPYYDIKIVNILTDVLRPLDPVSTFSRKKYTGEDFYNYCLRRRWFWLANNTCRIGRKLTLMKKKSVEKYVGRYLDKQDPDLIISVMPLINNAVYNAAKKRDKPFLIVTNDLDTVNYPNGIWNPTYRKFRYTLAFDDPTMRLKISRYNLKNEQIKVLGFPIRHDFFLMKDKKAIRKEFNLPDDKPIVMLLMGGAGSSSSLIYAKQIAKMDTPLHLVVALGRNEKLAKRVNALKRNSNITITTVGFTNKISDLMAVSKVIVTKSGPNSICEALYSDLPMIIDKTSTIMFWEKLNISFVEKHKFGDVIYKHKHVRKMLKKYLTNDTYYQSIKANMKRYKKKNFGSSIKRVVDSMFALT